MRRLTVGPRSKYSEARGTESESDCRAQYRSRWFSAASDLPLTGFFTSPGTLARFVAAAVRRPRLLAALIVLLLRTPREYVVLSRSCTGQDLHRYFNQRRLGVLPKNRLCRGVLLLPQDHADYLRGRRRQALRTNLRKAATAGIRCETVNNPSTALDAVRVVLSFGRTPWTDRDMEFWRASLTRPEITVAVACDQHGRPLAFAAAVIDDTVCLIRWARATCHEARWALHDHLVRILIARGVRYLLAEGGGPFGAVGFATTVQHYQHLLGYELRHLIPATAHCTMRRRRLLASLVAVAATVSLIVPQATASTLVCFSFVPATGTARMMGPCHLATRQSVIPRTAAYPRTTHRLTRLLTSARTTPPEPENDGLADSLSDVALAVVARHAQILQTRSAMRIPSIALRSADNGLSSSAARAMCPSWVVCLAQNAAHPATVVQGGDERNDVLAGAELALSVDLV